MKVTTSRKMHIKAVCGNSMSRIRTGVNAGRIKQRMLFQKQREIRLKKGFLSWKLSRHNVFRLVRGLEIYCN